MTKNISTTKPVYLIHHAGPNYSRITLRITISGMKVTAVTLDSNLLPIGKVFDHEIENECPTVGLDFQLPPDSYLVVRDLPELP